MVYNALKLFMEINPDLFDEAMQQYKQRKLECVVILFYLVFATLLRSCDSERQHAVERYEHWLKLRERAIEHAKGGKLPAGFETDLPSPPPPPVDEADIIDLSIDLNAVSLDAEVPLGDLDESGIERVPMADPGMDVSYNGHVYS